MSILGDKVGRLLGEKVQIAPLSGTAAMRQLVDVKVVRKLIKGSKEMQKQIRQKMLQATVVSLKLLPDNRPIGISLGEKEERVFLVTEKDSLLSAASEVRSVTIFRLLWLTFILSIRFLLLL